jgi:hypothetical protein
LRRTGAVGPADLDRRIFRVRDVAHADLAAQGVAGVSWLAGVATEGRGRIDQARVGVHAGAGFDHGERTHLLEVFLRQPDRFRALPCDVGIEAQLRLHAHDAEHAERQHEKRHQAFEQRGAALASG